MLTLLYLNTQAVLPASCVTMDDTVDFALFVTKDTRVSSTFMNIHVWPSNNSASALDGIDALLASGNTNAALLVINMVTGSLNTDAPVYNLMFTCICGYFTLKL